MFRIFESDNGSSSECFVISLTSKVTNIYGSTCIGKYTANTAQSEEYSL
jgi:hypothetical protein